MYRSKLARLLRVEAIVLYPFIFTVRPKDQVPAWLERHELKHVEQVRREGWLRFYFLYLFHYARELMATRDHFMAYYRNPFEVEARNAESRKVDSRPL